MIRVFHWNSEVRFPLQVLPVDVKQDVACMEAKNDGFLLIDLFGEKKWEAPFFQRPRLLRIGLRKGGQRPPRPVKRR